MTTLNSLLRLHPLKLVSEIWSEIYCGEVSSRSSTLPQNLLVLLQHKCLHDSNVDRVSTSAPECKKYSQHDLDILKGYLGKHNAVFFGWKKMPQVRALICNVTNTGIPYSIGKHARCRFASVRLDLLCKLPPLLQHASL